MYIKRNIAKILERYKKFPVIAILGPRQSGKTTLAKHEFKNYEFIDLDNIDNLNFAQKDPKGFLRSFDNKQGVIIDEFQNAPELLSYIKVTVDEKNRPGFFILTGSQNFLANAKISESLAGRIGILNLLPLSLNELKNANLLENYETLIPKGFYPRIYSQDILPQGLYPSYIQTYIEKDVRQLTNIVNLRQFQTFLQLCAGRIGNELNIADLATNCGIDQSTVKKWLSVLEASYILFLLPSYYKNFNKRLVKKPKIFFYDTGIASYLLGIKNQNDFFTSPFKGPLFENFIIADLYKQYFNSGERPPLYFWRDQNGRIEADCIVDKVSEIVPIEIKSSETFHMNFFRGLEKLSEISEQSKKNNFVVYAGDQNWDTKNGKLISWKNFDEFLKIFNKN